MIWESFALRTTMGCWACFSYLLMILGTISGSKSPDYGGEACIEIEDVMVCFIPVIEASKLMMTGGEVLPPSAEVQKLRTLCSFYDEALHCKANKLSACLNISGPKKMEIEVYSQGIMNEGIVKVCRNKAMFDAYVANAECLFKYQNETMDCLVKSRESFQREVDMTALSKTFMKEEFCSIINKLFACGRHTLQSHCSEEAGELFVQIASDFLPEHISKICFDYSAFKGNDTKAKAENSSPKHTAAARPLVHSNRQTMLITLALVLAVFRL